MEATDEQIAKYKERIRLKNQRCYLKHREERLMKAKENYKYEPIKVQCEVCKCEITAKGLREHKMSNKHVHNLKKHNEQIEELQQKHQQTDN